MTARRWYILVAVGVWLLLSGHAIDQDWSGDVWNHAAAVQRAAEDPFDPGNAITGDDVPHPFATPYHAVLGLVVATTGIEPLTLFRIVGPLNLAFVLAVFPRAVRALGGSSAASPVALLLLLFAWGISPWRYSGYSTANALGFSLPYPATFAFGLTLVGIAIASRLRTEPSPARAVSLGVLAAVVGVAHPLTGVILAIFVVAQLVAAERAAIRGFVVAGAVAAALALLWPQYSVLRLLTVAEEFDATNAVTVERLLPRAFLLLPGTVVALLRLRHRARDPLGIAAGLFVVAVAVGQLTQEPFFARLIPGLAPASAIAVAEWLRASFAEEAPSRRAYAVGVGAVVAVGIVGASPGIAHAVPDRLLPASLADDPRISVRSVEAIRELYGSLDPDDRVAVVESYPPEVVAGNGPTATTGAGPFDTEERARRRRQDTDVVVDPTASAAARTAAIERLGATHAVVPAGTGLPGEVIARSDTIWVIELPP